LVTNERTGAVRELDILVRHRENTNQRLLVECRDHKRKQNVQWIDELEGKASRLRFNHVIAVSSSGFTKPAVAEGRERGIVTLHVREAEELDWADWKFGLEQLGFSVHFDPVVRDIKLVVRAGFPKECPQDMTRESVAIVDTRRKTKVKLADWISGFQRDPKTAGKFPKPPESNAIRHYTCSIPCDPWIGFVIEPAVDAFPLERLDLEIDRINADYQVSLRHYRAGAEKFHVGHLDILGRRTRIVAHEREEGGKLQLMIEQLVHVDDKRYGIEQGRGELIVNEKDGTVVVCPTIPPPDVGLQLPGTGEEGPTNGSN